MRIINNLAVTSWYFLLLASINSCVIKGTLQGLYSYYDKTLKLKPGLINVKPIENSCTLKNGDTAKVYPINALDLKQCVDKNTNSIIYLWSPRCKSNLCPSLNYIQSKCSTLNYTLFIVAEYYDAELMSAPYKIEKPLYAIDTKYYRSDLTANYLKMFLKELISADETTGKFLVFMSGDYKTSYSTIDSIPLIKQN